MPTRQPPQLDALLVEALAQPPAERTAYVQRVCGSDCQLLGELQKLLQLHEQAGSFLESPAADPADFPTLGSERPSLEGAGSCVGPYKLLERIGEGGFGSVYMAEQREPVRRRVALKLIKLGMDTKQVIARFEAERQALAMMDHPNIARVLDAGATDTGRPYFVMELVRGIPITKFCDEDHLSIRQRLELFTAVCHAVQHAHQKGIIHRDIKPSNVLVTRHDDKAVPKVIDFGVAKATHVRLTEKTVFTEFRQLIGTPAYMSPEQAQMSGIDIDTRSDIYSLGVLLYELLTGTPPFDNKTLLDSGYEGMLRTIREVEPPRPSTRLDHGTKAQGHAGTKEDDSGAVSLRASVPSSLRASLVRGDLDWIVMKCLEKDRTRRYETANGLAADVQRHLVGEPVVAAPPSKLYRLRKVLRRYRVPATFAGALVVLILCGTVISTVFWQRAEANATKANRQAEETELAATLLADMLGETDPLAGLSSKTESSAPNNPNDVMRQRLDRFAASFEPKLAGHPDVEARVRLALSSAYRAIGEPNRAEPHQARALAIYRELYGPQHPKIATALCEWASLLHDRYDLTGAEATHREALAMRRQLLGNIHPDVAYSLTRLGDLLWHRSDWRESEAALQESLVITETLYGPETPKAFEPLSLLFRTMHDAGRIDEADVVGRRLVALNRKVFGNSDCRTANALLFVGQVLAQGTHVDQGVALMHEGVEILERAYPDGHPDLAQGLHHLALALHSLGRVDEALAMAHRAVEMYHKAPGFDAQEYGHALYVLVGMLQVAGRFGEAESAQRECVEYLRSRLPERHPMIRDALGPLGLILLREEKYAEAESPLRECLALRERALREEPGEYGCIANTRRLLAAALVGQGRFDDAGPLMHDGARTGLFPGAALWLPFVTASVLGNTLVNQAVLLIDTDGERASNLLREAEPLLLDGYGGLKDNSPAAERDLQVREALERLVKLYETWNQVAPGAGYAEKAAAWRARLDANEESPTSGPGP